MKVGVNFDQDIRDKRCMYFNLGEGLCETKPLDPGQSIEVKQLENN